LNSHRYITSFTRDALGERGHWGIVKFSPRICIDLTGVPMTACVGDAVRL